MGTRIHGVLRAANIIRGVIYTADLVAIDAVVHDNDLFTFFRREFFTVARPGGMNQSPKKMLLELWGKILARRSAGGVIRCTE
jgi:hypothetical protein